jgi:hypothetical protein
MGVETREGMGGTKISNPSASAPTCCVRDIFQAIDSSFFALNQARTAGTAFWIPFRAKK